MLQLGQTGCGDTLLPLGSASALQAQGSHPAPSTHKQSGEGTGAVPAEVPAPLPGGGQAGEAVRVVGITPELG